MIDTMKYFTSSEKCRGLRVAIRHRRILPPGAATGCRNDFFAAGGGSKLLYQKNFGALFGELLPPCVASFRSICERAKKIPNSKTETPRAPISLPQPIPHQKRNHCDNCNRKFPITTYPGKQVSGRPGPVRPCPHVTLCHYPVGGWSIGAMKG